jgi:arsenite methyltransferase
MSEMGPNYGLDAPGVVYGFLLGGPALLVGSWLLLRWAAPHQNVALADVAYAMRFTGIIFLLEAALMMWSSWTGKFHARDRLLDGLRLRGDEAVLDVGCGHGLLLIGAAKRLPSGRAVGIDLWSQKDQASNSREAVLTNAALERVTDRVEVQNGDMRKMPFADASFDAAIASLAIHNISSREGRRQAIGEIVRVLKPGGRVALLDFQKVGQYAADLRAAEMQDVRVSGPSFWIFPPVRTVTAAKTAPGI